VRAWYELGALFDSQGRYDEAMAAVVQAKDLLRPAASKPLALLAGVQARVREMESVLSAEMFDRWHGAIESPGGSRRLAILCGHPRSGTTLLEQVVDMRDDVVTAEETHVFHDEAYLPLSRDAAPDTPVLEMLDSAAPGDLRRARDEYVRCLELLLGEPIGKRLLLDKNPALTALLPAVARLFPEARILVVLRDPRDVCLSCFMQPLALNPMSSAYLTIEDTVTQFCSVMGFWNAIRPHLRNPWIEVRYEDMVDDLDSVDRKVREFLDLGDGADPARFHEHARTRLIRSPSYAEVARPVFRRSVGRWKNYERFLDPDGRGLSRLAPVLRALGYE
jgi:hypothetical protein